jgi:nitrile hydratase accessory protein
MRTGGAPDPALGDLAGNAALPRQNGELVFAAPWEGRVFGLAVALHERGLYTWDEFRDRLIAEFARADRAGDPSTYYERWLAAFERLLLDKGMLAREDLDARTTEFASEQRAGE